MRRGFNLKTMLIFMLISFIRLLNVTGSILQEPAKNIDLQAKTNEVWRFSIPKSDINNLCPNNLELVWQKKETCDSVLPQDPFFAGNIDYLQAEKYGSLSFIVESINGSGFSIMIDDEPIFESQSETFIDLVAELEEQEGIVSVFVDNNEINLKINKDYCKGVVTISNSPFFATQSSVTLLTDSVKCCCLSELQVDVLFPCTIGCYELQVRKKSDSLIIAKSEIIYVSTDVSNTVLLNYYNSKKIFGQNSHNLSSIIRVPGRLIQKAFDFQTAERELTNGQFKRTESKITENFHFLSNKNTLQFQKNLLICLNYENVFIDGQKMYLKSFEQSDVINERSGALFVLNKVDSISQLNEGCGVSCSDNFAKIESDYDFVLESETNTKTTKSTSVEPGEYQIKLSNTELNVQIFSVFKNGILSKEIEVNSKKCKSITLYLCECDLITIKRNERSC